MQCSSQVRVGAMGGGVVGLDFPALLRMGEALGYDVRGVAEMLPALEAGMLSGLARLRGEGLGEDEADTEWLNET